MKEKLVSITVSEEEYNIILGAMLNALEDAAAKYNRGFIYEEEKMKVFAATYAVMTCVESVAV